MNQQILDIHRDQVRNLLGAMFVDPGCSEYVVSRVRPEAVIDLQLREIYEAVEQEVIGDGRAEGELFVRALRRLRFYDRLSCAGGVEHLVRIVEGTRDYPTIDIRVDKVLMSAEMLLAH